MDLTALTPVEIDTALADAYSRIAILKAKSNRLSLQIKYIDGIEPGSYESKMPGYGPADRDKLIEEIECNRDEIDVIDDAEVRPREAEYHRRGRWTRYFLVDNTNGHVHKDTSCSTCFFDTRYSWLVEQSGMSAEDLVELAGEDACTVCFPWAPVETLRKRSLLEAPERKKVRLEREAKKAAQEAAKAAKSITTPEGEKLYPGKSHDSWDVCKTLRTAEIAATDALLDFLLDQARENDPEWAHRFERQSYAQYQFENTRHAWYLLRAIAAKKGQTFQEVFDIHEKKAQAKHRRMQREWAKDFRNPNRVK